MERDHASVLAAIKSDPEFQALVKSRSRLAWSLSFLMVLIYFGFVLLIAFNKELLGASLFGGVTTVGIPVGLGVIISAFVLTGVYVALANSTYDDMLKRILDRVTRS